jgi:hypothetical protein
VAGSYHTEPESPASDLDGDPEIERKALLDAFGAGNHAAALKHWLEIGLSEGRPASDGFEVGYYLAANADLQAAFGADNFAAAWEHWLTNGKAEGRRPKA